MVAQSAAPHTQIGYKKSERERCTQTNDQPAAADTGPFVLQSLRSLGEHLVPSGGLQISISKGMSGAGALHMYSGSLSVVGDYRLVLRRQRLLKSPQPVALELPPPCNGDPAW